MVSKINSFLGFDKGFLPNGELLAIGQDGQDGSFILQHIVSGAVKENLGVVLVSLAQKLHHYNTISQKMGTNLISAKDAGKLSFIDGLQLLSQTFFPADQNFSFSSEENMWRETIMEESVNSFLERFKNGVVTELTALVSVTPSAVLVIDDISVLLSVGYKVEDVCVMVQTLLESVFMLGGSDPKPLKWQGLSVVVLCTYDEIDKDSKILWSYLSHISSLWVNVKGLETGYCKDVHGQACVTWQDGIDMPRTHHTQTQQFKVLENGADFFATGTSPAIL